MTNHRQVLTLLCATMCLGTLQYLDFVVASTQHLFLESTCCLFFSNLHWASFLRPSCIFWLMFLFYFSCFGYLLIKRSLPILIQILTNEQKISYYRCKSIFINAFLMYPSISLCRRRRRFLSYCWNSPILMELIYLYYSNVHKASRFLATWSPATLLMSVRGIWMICRDLMSDAVYTLKNENETHIAQCLSGHTFDIGRLCRAFIFGRL